MRIIVVLFAACAAITLPASGLSAQCATGCISSTSCDGSGKGSCKTVCQGNWCGCTDTRCDGQLEPPLIGTLPLQPEFVSSAVGVIPALLVDCSGYVLDVHLRNPHGQAAFEDLIVVSLSPPGSAPERSRSGTVARTATTGPLDIHQERT